MTITEFLEARIGEDEVAAKVCLEPANLVPYSDSRIPAIKPDEWGALVDNYLGGPMGKHCARHDPTRVLAECAAKRKLVQIQFQFAQKVDGEWGCCHSAKEIRRGDCDYLEPGDFPILASLAAVYKDHPDYRQEWAA